MKLIVYRALSVISVFAAVAIAYSFEFSDMEDTRARVESIDGQPAGRIEPLPEFMPRIRVAFDEITDPFRITDSDTDAAMPGFDDRDLPREQSSVRLKPGDLSLLGREAGRALVKLPDGAVYLVGQGDALWGGDVIIQQIDENGVTIKYMSSGEVVILDKFDIR